MRRSALALAVAVVCAGTSRAGNTVGDRWWWVGLEAGGGVVKRDRRETSTDSAIYLSFKGGLAVTEHLLLGIELGGYTLESGNLWDPAEGAGISKSLFVAQVYPSACRTGWYGKVGGGYLSYWDHDPDGQEGNGWGATAAIGYDFSLGGFGSLGPLVSLSYGDAGALRHQALALALGWTFP